MYRIMSVAALALAAGALPLGAAVAAGPYDGTWVVDAPQAGGAGAQEGAEPTGCEPLRLEFQVQDNRITGSLKRSPYGGARVTPGTGPGSAPITGTVGPDGTINAQWQQYKATGRLSGDHAEVRWNGQCGPRIAMGGRANGTEGSGSSRNR